MVLPISTAHYSVPTLTTSTRCRVAPTRMISPSTIRTPTTCSNTHRLRIHPMDRRTKRGHPRKSPHQIHIFHQATRRPQLTTTQHKSTPLTVTTISHSSALVSRTTTTTTIQRTRRTTRPPPTRRTLVPPVPVGAKASTWQRVYLRRVPQRDIPPQHQPCWPTRILHNRPSPSHQPSKPARQLLWQRLQQRQPPNQLPQENQDEHGGDGTHIPARREVLRRSLE